MRIKLVNMYSGIWHMICSQVLGVLLIRLYYLRVFCFFTVFHRPLNCQLFASRAAFTCLAHFVFALHCYGANSRSSSSIYTMNTGRQEWISWIGQKHPWEQEIKAFENRVACMKLFSCSKWVFNPEELYSKALKEFGGNFFGSFYEVLESRKMLELKGG